MLNIHKTVKKFYKDREKSKAFMKVVLEYIFRTKNIFLF